MKLLVFLVFIYKICAFPIQDDHIVFPDDTRLNIGLQNNSNSDNIRDNAGNLSYNISQLLNDPNLLPSDNESIQELLDEQNEENFEYGDNFEGDIELNPEQEVFLNSSDDGEISTRTGLISLAQRWPKNPNGKVVVPLAISDDYSNTQKNKIIKATKDIEKYTCIKFIPRKNQHDFINIFPGANCHSRFGKIGGMQDLSLNKKGCLQHGIIMHELIHALGFAHMHNRANRDEHVKILWENIEQNHDKNFLTVNSKKFKNFSNNYDYHSIMHYGPTAFGIRGKTTIVVVKDKSMQKVIGQRVRLSVGDAQRINKMYECQI